MTSRPFLLGLTGSIGMGKSTTATLFRDLGVPVWDADAAVHRLYAKGGAAVAPIMKLRHEAVRDGAVSRPVLKSWIVEDPEALARIEAVVHPLVAEDRQGFIADHAQIPLIVLDIPLLFETGTDAWLDAVLVVTADPDTQRRRVLSRPGMTEAQFRAILAKQMPDAEKRRRADFVIETRTLEQTRAEVHALVKRLRKRDA
ncbi:dephospho-CoA kinase [Rhodovulum sp. ES.010]|uniref:dephospho-CoA kinase n=1 Tax=Rhodovulum sp. ES.010 TaxID=1882821 RepID=UPI00092A83CA|nr:dephospho-CoA kinase [Rhodovulum sp. ES.010]SIO49465.1 dephospho-CoA kinase [Rhodovulum sp. ES.010]